MDSSFTNSINENHLFNILAHPLRRKILKTMFENGNVTFTILSKEWNIPTGTIYHHLKALDPLIYQDSSSVYHLNETGKQVSEWFLHTKKGNVTVRKINAFTVPTRSIIGLIEDHSTLFLIISLLGLLLGYYVSTLVHVIIIGSFMLPIPSFLRSEYALIFNFIMTVGILILFLLTTYIAFSRKDFLDKNLIAVFFVSLFPNIMFLSLIYIISSFITLHLTLIFWITLSFFNQLVFLFLNSGILVSNYGVSVEKSIIVVFSNLYFQVLIVFLFI